MAINDEIYRAPATRGEIAGPVIKTSIALDHICLALEAINEGKDISKNIIEIKKKARELDELFDDLTGWQKDGG